MGEKGFDIVSSNGKDAIFTFLMTTPFYPNISIQNAGSANQETKVKFNQGYVFDYSNADTLKDPIKIDCSKEFTISGDDTTVEIYVMLVILKSTGKVVEDKCELVKKGAPEWETPTNPYKRLPITTDFYANIDEGDLKAFTKDTVVPESADDEFKWFIKLAEFENEQIKELYLRDNLHLNLLKIRQLGEKSSGEGGGDRYSILAEYESTLEPDNIVRAQHKSWQGNGVLPFVSLAPMGNDHPLVNPQYGSALLMSYDSSEGVVYIGTDGSTIQTQIDNAIANHEH